MTIWKIVRFSFFCEFYTTRVNRQLCQHNTILFLIFVIHTWFHIRLGLVVEEMMEEKRKEKEENNAGQDWVRIAGVTDRYWRWATIIGFKKYNPDPRLGRSGLLKSQTGVERGRGATLYDDEVEIIELCPNKIAQVPLLLLPLDLPCQHQHVSIGSYSILY